MTDAWSRFRSWGRTPPVMERTLGDDVKVGVAILTGGALACLIGIAPWSALLPAAVGVVLVTAVLNVVRRVGRRKP